MPVDKDAAESRFRDEEWRRERDRKQAENATLTNAEFINRICEQIRSGKQ